MNKDLEQFENRSDDWLASEKRLEERVSAWDIDEGKRIKQFHEDHCEANYIKQTHEKAHAEYNRNTQKSPNDFVKVDDKLTLIISMIIIIMVVVGVFIIATTGEIEFQPFIAAIFIFWAVRTLKKNNKKEK